jgi:hypothetical protein
VRSEFASALPPTIRYRREIILLPASLDSFDVVLSRNGMGFLCDTFPCQLLTVLAVILSRPDSGRFIVREKHIDVPTEQVGSNHTVEGRAAFEGS